MNKVVSSVLLLALGAGAGFYGNQYAGSLLNGTGSSEPAADEPLYWVAPMDANYRRDKPGLSPMGMELVPVYPEKPAPAAVASDEPLYWVAPMDANYRRDKPGLSPMGMELVPVYPEAGGGDSPGTVSISAQVENNLGVRSAPVEFGRLQQTIRAVGYISFDEDQLQHIHTRLPGWVRKLYVKTDGAWIEKGQPLYELYAPELITAQEEYLSALRSNSKILARSARAKLQALSVSDAAISALRKRGRAQDTITVAAPVSGYVDGLSIREGMFVKPSLTLMSVGPLDQVWVMAEVFERQAGWLAEGSAVQMQLDYSPGKRWQGKVDYIYPTLDSKTRAQKVRLRFDNAERALKPGMFARVDIAGRRSEPRLHIPTEALIQTADQQRVVVSLGDGKFKSVAVATGLRTNNRVTLLEGLELGDEVVTSAQFLLDSESAINSDLQRISDPDSPWPTAWVDAELISLDLEARTLTLSHGDILRWQQPAMQMALPVADTVMLEGLQPGLKLKVQLRSEEGDVQVSELLIPDQPLPRVSTEETEQ